MGRGPSYPYIGLEESIGMTRKVYDFAKRAPAQTEAVMTEAWKFSPTSSGSQKTLAALRSFGLVEDVPGTNGKSIKLTQRSIHILLETGETPQKRAEVQKAALSPRWYSYCWKTWGKEMPPAMRSNLLIEHGFIESTIEDFLKNYRKTIAFAGLLDNMLFGNEGEEPPKSTDSFKVGDYVQWESQGVLRMPEARKLTHYSPEGDYGFVDGYATGIPVKELIAGEVPEAKAHAPSNVIIPAISKSVTITAGELKMQVDTFALSDGITVQFQWPTEITQDAFEDFVYQLEGLKKRVQRAVRKEASPQPGVLSENAP